MTEDLEKTLVELGSDYRTVVDRIQRAYERPVLPIPHRAGETSLRPAAHLGRMTGWSAAYLVAASLLVFLGLGFFLRPSGSARTSETHLVYTVAYAADEAALSAILASQRADGSWENDFITRQNAAALRRAESGEMRIAYKKAVRYLKSRGLQPLSETELKARSDAAAKALMKS